MLLVFNLNNVLWFELSKIDDFLVHWAASLKMAQLASLIWVYQMRLISVPVSRFIADMDNKILTVNNGRQRSE